MRRLLRERPARSDCEQRARDTPERRGSEQVGTVVRLPAQEVLEREPRTDRGVASRRSWHGRRLFDDRAHLGRSRRLRAVHAAQCQLSPAGPQELFGSTASASARPSAGNFSSERSRPSRFFVTESVTSKL